MKRFVQDIDDVAIKNDEFRRPPRHDKLGVEWSARHFSVLVAVLGTTTSPYLF